MKKYTMNMKDGSTLGFDNMQAIKATYREMLECGVVHMIKSIERVPYKNGAILDLLNYMRVVA